MDPRSGDDAILDFVATGAAQGAFDHIALRDIRPDQVSVSDADDGALVSWDVDGDEGSVLLVGLAPSDLRQSDFMFLDEPGFVEGIDATGSHYIFPQSSRSPTSWPEQAPGADRSPRPWPKGRSDRRGAVAARLASCGSTASAVANLAGGPPDQGFAAERKSSG